MRQNERQGRKENEEKEAQIKKKKEDMNNVGNFEIKIDCILSK